MNIRLNCLIAMSAVAGAVVLSGCDQSSSTSKEATPATNSTMAAPSNSPMSAPPSNSMAPDSTNSATNSTNSPQ